MVLPLSYVAGIRLVQPNSDQPDASSGVFATATARTSDTQLYEVRAADEDADLSWDVLWGVDHLSEAHACLSAVFISIWLSQILYCCQDDRPTVKAGMKGS